MPWEGEVRGTSVDSCNARKERLVEAAVRCNGDPKQQNQPSGFGNEAENYKHRLLQCNCKNQVGIWLHNISHLNMSHNRIPLRTRPHSRISNAGAPAYFIVLNKPFQDSIALNIKSVEASPF